MSKVICEICGTSYPETSEQCPICGYTRDLSVLLSRDDIEAASAPKPAASASVRGSTDDDVPVRRSSGKSASSRPAAPKSAPAPAAKSKGGKFSQGNVRKRADSAAPARGRRDEEPEEEYEKPVKKESNGFLVVLLLIVIVALLAVTGYIGVKYFLPYALAEETEPTETQVQQTEAPEVTEPVEVPCTSIVLVSGGSVKLDQIGQNWLLNVIVLPIDTTDALVFTSSDESVATVNSEGKVTAVGPGEAVITITCGGESMECKITCTADADSTEEAAGQDNGETPQEA